MVISASLIPQRNSLQRGGHAVSKSKTELNQALALVAPEIIEVTFGIDNVPYDVAIVSCIVQ